ncbi:hypothetical protein RI367_000797 [Sorochytrium milnesiophthora]
MDKATSRDQDGKRSSVADRQHAAAAIFPAPLSFPASSYTSNSTASDGVFDATTLLFAEPSTIHTARLMPVRRGSSSGMDSTVSLEGYQLYVVEQWYTDRTRPLHSMVVYTGDATHSVRFVSVVVTPAAQQGARQHNQQWTPLGNLYAGSLTNLDASLNIIHVPDGDFDAHRDAITLSINMRRLGDAQREKFHQLFKVPRSTSSLAPAIVELVKFVQVSLYLMGYYKPSDFDYAQQSSGHSSIAPSRPEAGALVEPLPDFVPDGLLCNQTMTALETFLDEVGHGSAEGYGGVCEPSAVALLISRIAAMRARMAALAKDTAKDPFTEYLQFQRNIQAFQRSRQLPVTGYLSSDTIGVITDESQARLAAVAHLSVTSKNAIGHKSHRTKFEDIREVRTIDELVSMLAPLQLECERLSYLWPAVATFKGRGGSLTKTEMGRLLSNSIRQGRVVTRRRSALHATAGHTPGTSSGHGGDDEGPGSGSGRVHALSDDEHSVDGHDDMAGNRVEGLIQGGKDFASVLLRGVGGGGLSAGGSGSQRSKRKATRKEKAAEQSMSSSSASDCDTTDDPLSTSGRRVLQKRSGKRQRQFTSALLRLRSSKGDHRIPARPPAPVITHYTPSEQGIRAHRTDDEGSQSPPSLPARKTNAVDDHLASGAARHLLDGIPLRKARRQRRSTIGGHMAVDHDVGSSTGGKKDRSAASKRDKSPGGFRFRSSGRPRTRESGRVSSDGGAESETGRSRLANLAFRLRPHKTSSLLRRSPIEARSFLSSISLPRSPLYYNDHEDALGQSQAISRRIRYLQKQVQKQQRIHPRSRSLPDLRVPDVLVAVPADPYVNPQGGAVRASGRPLSAVGVDITGNITGAITLGERSPAAASATPNTDSAFPLHEEVVAELEAVPRLRRTHSLGNLEVVRWRRSDWVRRLEMQLGNEVDSLRLSDLAERESQLLMLIESMEPYREQLSVIQSLLQSKYEARQEDVMALRHTVEELQDRQEGLLDHLSTVEHVLHRDVSDAAAHHQDQFSGVVLESVEQFGALVQQLSDHEAKSRLSDRMNPVLEALYAVGSGVVALLALLATRVFESSSQSISSVFSVERARKAARKLRELSIAFEKLLLSKSRSSHEYNASPTSNRKRSRRQRNRSPHAQQRFSDAAIPTLESVVPSCTDDNDDNYQYISWQVAMPNVDLVDTAKYETQRPDQATAQAWDDGSVEKLFEAQNLAKTKLKRLVRNGVPDGIRSLVWPEFVKMHKMPQYERNYSRAIFRIHGNHLPDPTAQQQLFGGSLHNEYTCLTRKGYLHATRLLSIIAYDYPEIEFCPSISALTVLLLHHINPDDVLGILNHMLKRSLADKEKWTFFPMTKKDLSAFNYAFADVINKMHPQLYKHLHEMGSSTTGFWNRWFSDFFIGVFPLHLIFHMIDSFIIEGYKVLLRFGYAYLTLLKDRLMAMNDTRQIRDLFTVAHFDLDAHELVTLAHSLKLSKKQVQLSRAAYFAKKGIDTGLHDLGAVSAVKLLPKLSEPSAMMNDDLWMEVWHHVPNRHRIHDLELVFTTKKHGHNLNTFYDMVNERQPSILLVETLDGEVLGAYCSGMWPPTPQDRNKFAGTGESFVFGAKPKFKAYQWVGARQTAAVAVPGWAVTPVAAPIPLRHAQTQPASRLSPFLAPFALGRSRSASPAPAPAALRSPTSPAPSSATSDSTTTPSPRSPAVASPNVDAIPELDLNASDATSLFMMGGNKELVIGGGGSGQAIWIDESLTRGSTDTCATFANQPLIPTKNFDIATIEVFSFKSL